ncbi:MAG: hypothetical protein GEV12_02995 [Micromonosporaceae bacterium]|nr:hypothetical protein [Micromonosporaceae bacterium]
MLTMGGKDMATVVDLAHGRAAVGRRLRRPDPAHTLLIAVSAAYCLLIFLRTPQSMTLTFDEVVYASQLSVDTPAAEFADHRARGLPLLLAPVVMVTEWVFALRAYLTLLSGVLMYLAFRPWLTVFGRVGGRFRYVPAVAAGGFATLWMAVLFGTMAYPNLWLAFLLVAGVGFFCRAVVEPPPAWGPVVGVLVTFALASLVRPPDALAAAGPLLVAAVLVRRWRRLWPPVAVGTGLLIGWGAWFGEAVARFGGPLARLRDGAESTGSGLVNALPANLVAVDGPSLLCRSASGCGGVDPVAAAWWVLLPVLVAAGLAVAARTHWLGAGGLATASAVAFAVPYLLLLDYSSPRFLLPGYALLALPVAGLLVWFTGLGGDRSTRALITAVVAGAGLLHVVIQQDVLETAAGRMENTYGRYTRLAEFLREEQNVRPPCLVWGQGAVPLSYPLKCHSAREPGGQAPSEGDPAIAAALVRGDTVLVRIRADEDPPRFMAGWRRVELPGNRAYVGYLPPADR